MSVHQSLQEINHRAISVLCHEIGITNTLRFIRQFSTGHGNYTHEREDMLKDKTMDGILSEIKQIRAAKQKQR
ncbi:MAG: hypothetical protein HY842_09835 [Bacteroidetes bacterium]|nr:hypothetical protein [Bacteroidota bacterium]